ncbi:ADP-ribosylation factor-like protein 14 isoform X2 [Anguilla anguilla]|uniref:ADP-ribosylation factor-like protein 14 isoform X2 n=1 Tax=Anguilla anguilla TaxID=7936 RepID=UPI0015AF9785|nr:ADP-ribosylation factor-like protein 14 isoform X2 [Anguilla anguilla]
MVLGEDSATVFRKTQSLRQGSFSAGCVSSGLGAGRVLSRRLGAGCVSSGLGAGCVLSRRLGAGCVLSGLGAGCVLSGMGQRSSRLPGETRVLILGLDMAGKSTLLYKLKYNEAVLTVPTVGFNVEMMETERRASSLTVWDVGGQREMRPHWEQYFQDTAGLVFVVDCADRTRLGEAQREFERVLKSEHLQRVPVVILANKQDVPGAVGAVELTQRFGLRRACVDRHWFVQPCSARSGAGLQDGFRRMVQFIKAPSLLTDNPIADTVSSLRSTAISLKHR